MLQNLNERKKSARTRSSFRLDNVNIKSLLFVTNTVLHTEVQRCSILRFENYKINLRYRNKVYLIT